VFVCSAQEFIFVAQFRARFQFFTIRLCVCFDFLPSAQQPLSRRVSAMATPGFLRRRCYVNNVLAS